MVVDDRVRSDDMSEFIHRIAFRDGRYAAETVLGICYGS